MSMTTYNREIRQKESLRMVENRDVTDIENIVKQLNEEGIIVSFYDPSFLIQVMEYWTSPCTEHLKKNGYKGGALDFVLNYYEDIGNEGALYDINRYSLEEDALPNPYDYLTKKVKGI